jgi:hypothetical protein
VEIRITNFQVIVATKIIINSNFLKKGGFFLYMALVDVMTEMNRSMENASRKGAKSMLQIWALQNIGIVISVIFLALLAFYEREMDFGRVQLEELAEHSLKY